MSDTRLGKEKVNLDVKGIQKRIEEMVKELIAERYTVSLNYCLGEYYEICDLEFDDPIQIQLRVTRDEDDIIDDPPKQNLIEFVDLWA